MGQINPQLIEHVKTNLFPIYESFDPGHDIRHIQAVINRSLELADFLNDENLNINIVYAVAAYHDIGMTVSRKGHARFSHDYVLKDYNLKKFFSDDEILIIAQACEDHSTSTGRIPRSIYGKIVSDADKDNDLTISLMRGWDYSTFNSPQLSFEEHINEIHEQIRLRFGENGSVKFYLNAPKNQSFLRQMRSFADNKDAFRKTMQEILSNLDREK